VAGTMTRTRRLFAAVLGAALVAAVADAGITAIRSPSLFTLTQTFLGALADLGFTVACLAIAGSFVVLLAVLVAGLEAGTALIARPAAFVEGLWREDVGAAEVGAALGRFAGVLTGQLVFLALLFGGSVLAVDEFHEPVRTSLFIAGVGFIAAALGYAMGRQAGDRWLTPLFVRLGGKTTFLGRLSLIFILGLPVAASVVLAVKADEVFGTFDPAPVAMIAVFVLLLSVAVHWGGLLLARFLRPAWVPVVGVVALGFAVTLASLVPGARGPLNRGGALGGTVYHGVLELLDMDGDGFAWLMGGDCHPFDPNAGPFALELPGNGYDENCDGADVLVAASNYVDPISALGKASRQLTRIHGNVLLVILDATRKDHLSIYGYRRDTMPALTRFAAKSVVFDNFFAASNHTAISMPSLLTGRFPSVFPAVLNRTWHSFRINEDLGPIQHLLKRRGYEARMFAGHRLGGFVGGFDFVNKRGKKRVNAADLSALALADLKRIGGHPTKPVLMGVHFIDAHHPYRPPVDPYRFGRASSDRYDAELNYVDDHLEPILELMESEEYKDWLVVITSDHGEGHYEHGTPHHGYVLYDEEVRVPLVLRVPGAEAGSRHVAVSQLDINPTIQEWTGRRGAKRLPGRSLLPLVERGPLPKSARRVVFAECFRGGDTYAAFDGRYSLIFRQKESVFELYDGVADPMQRRNRYRRGAEPLLEELLRNHIRVSRARLDAHEARRAKKGTSSAASKSSKKRAKRSKKAKRSKRHKRRLKPLKKRQVK